MSRPSTRPSSSKVSAADPGLQSRELAQTHQPLSTLPYYHQSLSSIPFVTSGRPVRLPHVRRAERQLQSLHNPHQQLHQQVHGRPRPILPLSITQFSLRGPALLHSLAQRRRRTQRHLCRLAPRLMLLQFKRTELILPCRMSSVY